MENKQEIQKELDEINELIRKLKENRKRLIKVRDYWYEQLNRC